MTKYEEKIFNIINASSSHMTIDEIFGELRKEEPNVVLATVYNNVNRLVQEGLAQAVQSRLLRGETLLKLGEVKGAEEDAAWL